MYILRHARFHHIQSLLQKWRDLMIDTSFGGILYISSTIHNNSQGTLSKALTKSRNRIHVSFWSSRRFFMAILTVGHLKKNCVSPSYTSLIFSFYFFARLQGYWIRSRKFFPTKNIKFSTLKKDTTPKGLVYRLRNNLDCISCVLILIL